MSLLILTNQLHTGGAETWVVTVANWLAARGEPPVVAATPGALVDRLDAGVRFFPLPLKDLRASIPMAAWRVRGLVRRFKPTAIVANSMVTTWVARLAVGTGVPVIAVAHGWPAHRYRVVARPLAVADRVVAVSEDVRRRLIDAGLPAHKVVVVPNGVDLARFTPRDASTLAAARSACGAEPEDVLMISVGRFVDQKAQHHLVEIARRLKADVPSLRVALVGWGPREAELRAAITAAGLDDRVRLLIDRKDVPDLLLASDLYVSTSDWEGMPLSTIEAMAAGLPIVTTATEGVSALVDDNNGHVVPVGDVPAMAAAVQALAADEPGRLQLGSESRARAAAKFSSEVMCAGLMRVIEQGGT